MDALEAVLAPAALVERRQHGSEARLVELQGTELLHHRRVERLRRLAPPVADALGGRDIGLARLLLAPGEPRHGVAAIVERGAARGDLGAQDRQRVERDPVLAGPPPQRRPPPLTL